MNEATQNINAFSVVYGVLPLASIFYHWTFVMLSYPVFWLSLANIRQNLIKVTRGDCVLIENKMFFVCLMQ